MMKKTQLIITTGETIHVADISGRNIRLRQTHEGGKELAERRQVLTAGNRIVIDDRVQLFYNDSPVFQSARGCRCEVRAG
jgi:hypothetical protein